MYMIPKKWGCKKHPFDKSELYPWQSCCESTPLLGKM